MLGKSRFNRRLHAVAELIYDLQQQLGQMWMTLNDRSEYLLDSFFSQITGRFPKKIHAVTFGGFLVKVSCFIWTYSLEKAFL